MKYPAEHQFHRRLDMTGSVIIIIIINYFRSAVICISKSALGISENPGYLPFWEPYLRTAVYQFRSSGTEGIKKKAVMSKVQSKFFSASLFATANLRLRSPYHFPEPVPNLGEHPDLYRTWNWSPGSIEFLVLASGDDENVPPREAVAISSDSQYIRGSSSPQEPRSQTLWAEGDEAAALYNEVCYSL